MKLYAVGINDMKIGFKCKKKYVMLVEAYSVIQAKHKAIAMCRERYRFDLKGDYLKAVWIEEGV